MKKDAQLQLDVQDAIRWEPSLNVAEIGVIAKDGVITLTGIVDSYSKKLRAEKVAQNVHGVKAVAESMEVTFGIEDVKNDTEIANEILNGFKWNWKVPNHTVKIKVEKGWVTLDGELQWNYQREATIKAVGNLLGVKGITNNIKIKNQSTDGVEKEAIQRALSRNSSINDKEITVQVNDNNVKLTGIVHSMQQKDEASRIAWNAPGVCSLENELIIDLS